MSYTKLCVHILLVCILVALDINCVSVKSPYSRRSQSKKQRSSVYNRQPSKGGTLNGRSAGSARDSTRHRSYSYAKADQKGSMVVPKGTVIAVVMETNLSSKTNKRNDPFTARTAEPVVIGGRTLLPSGTRLRGRVESVTRFFRRSKMKLRFAYVTLQDGRHVQMNANEYDPKKGGGIDKLAKKGGRALEGMVVEKGLEAATDGALMPFFALKHMKKAHDAVTKEESETYRRGQRITIKLNEPLYLPRSVPAGPKRRP